MDEKETLKTSDKPDAPEVAEKDLDQVNGGGVATLPFEWKKRRS